MKKNATVILVEFQNTAPFVYKVISNDPITLDRVEQHFIETENFNAYRDSLTMIDEITCIDLDAE